MEAWFNDSADIQNIFSRVTGGQVSNIDGLIRANGAANLFLLNPNGIIFGPNASLDVGGSFVGTSADSLKFADGSEFSAVNPQAPPLLEINVPMGLQYGPNPGEIAVNESRLQVDKGETLGLIGGNVSISGGESGLIEAEGGRVELGGLAATGLIGINGQQLEEEFSLESFTFPEGIARANVQLSNSASIDVRSDGGGSIAINAQDINMKGGEQGRSILRAGIAPNSSSPEAIAGDININATDNITVSQESRILNQVASTGVGNAGNINITTTNLTLTNGGRVSASTFGRGNAGNLIIDADTLQLKDGGTITAQSRGTGIAGNIIIDLKNNLNADNGQIITQAEESRGGDITITAGENIFLRNNSDIRTTLSTTADSGGNINLNANAIVALEDSDILAFAPQGRGGNITFNTNAFLSDSLFNTTAQTTDSLTESELNELDGNNRVDVNATGSISSGNISGIPDISQLQNSLTQLTTNAIDTEAIVASSCVAPSRERKGTFYIVGQASLPYRPGEAVPSVYSAVGVQPIPQETPPTPRWKKGDPIIEPTGVYLLEDGQRILSRECGT